MYKFLLLISLLFSLIACDTAEKVSLDNQSNTQELPIANNIQDQEQMRMEKEEQMRMEKEEHEQERSKFSHYVEEFGTKGILDLDNLDGIDLSWPRKVEAMNGEIIIEKKPERIVTVSVGHDEILFGFADIDTIVAVSSFSQDQNGNIYELTKELPTISSEIETIIAQQPDLVFADPYANPSLLESLKDIGITVVQTQLNNDYIGRINDILFTSYVIGQTNNVFELINVIEEKISVIDKFKKKFDYMPKILSVTYYDAYWAAGAGSTEGSIIELAGGLNIAAENGVISNNMITKVALVDMNYFTTLSHWNIDGTEKLMQILREEWDKVVDNLPKFYPCMSCDIYN